MSLTRRYQMPFGPMWVRVHCPGPRPLAARIEAAMVRLSDASHRSGSKRGHLRRSLPRPIWPTSMFVTVHEEDPGDGQP